MSLSGIVTNANLFGKHHHLPSRQLAYNYAVAMFFGQDFEVHLRALLYTADYHRWGQGFTLTDEQRRRYKETDVFIDKATCGAIIAAIRTIKIINEDKLVRFFERACSHRNRLAHSFLSEHDFNTITPAAEAQVLESLHLMTVDLYKAARFSKALRTLIEIEADKDEGKTRELLGEFVGEIEHDPNRKYSTRTRRRSSK